MATLSFTAIGQACFACLSACCWLALAPATAHICYARPTIIRSLANPRRCNTWCVAVRLAVFLFLFLCFVFVIYISIYFSFLFFFFLFVVDISVSLSSLHACCLVCFSIGIITVKRAKCSGCQSRSCCQRISACTVCCYTFLLLFCCYSCRLVKLLLLRLSSVDFSVLEHHETPLCSTQHSPLAHYCNFCFYCDLDLACGRALSSRLQRCNIRHSLSYCATTLAYITCL